MKKNSKNIKIVIVLILTLLSAVKIDAAIPVVDTNAIIRLLTQLDETLEKYRDEISIYKKIVKIKDEYIRSMRLIIYRSETLFNAITYFPKTVPGQFEVNPYFYDQLKKDIWGILFQQNGKIEDKYPEFGDFSYIKENPLYEKNEKYREYADKVLKLNKDDKKDMDNQFGLIKLMKEFQQERARLLDDFKNVIVPAFGSGKDEEEEKKVVDVTKLYYAIGKAKLEVLKQKLELLLMEKEMMEDYIKREVNNIRNKVWLINYTEVE